MSQHPETKDQIRSIYQSHIDRHRLALQKLKKLRLILSIARLIAVAGAVGLCWYFWPSAEAVTISLILSSVCFAFLVFRDTDKKAEIKNHERLILVNQHELDVLQHNVQNYADGNSFYDAAHAYAADLDLFGPFSLFQWLNRCHSDPGKKRLADYLKRPPEPTSIRIRQAASKELSEKLLFCQQFQSTAMEHPVTFRMEKKVAHWMASPAVGFQHSFWNVFQNLYPVIPIGMGILFLTDKISGNVFSLSLLVFFCISAAISRKVMPELRLLSEIEPEMATLQRQLHGMEKENFRSEWLLSLQQKLHPPGQASASAAIREFHLILKRMDWRANLVVFPFLFIFLIWDLRLILSLHTWKKKNQNRLTGWIDAIAELEVTISLASVVFNEPDWCIPEVDDAYFHMETVASGHPLIPYTDRVCNDFTLRGTGKIALITGSNMAGKSTFLRSLGINAVLAQIGAPACASRLSLSGCRLISSMRVADNLAENTSTFYAELKKLKFIIDSVNRNEPVFILLDEVLRGTNSTDRHAGSRALVRQLLKTRAVTVMATHDTELAHTESEYASVSNYHFEGRIQNEELTFDYKIREGICESLNATALMKKIGIHFED